jgi:hypothetical protein
MRNEESVIIPLSKARLCATFYCETIHTNQNCPKCASGEFLFLESILNQEDKFKNTYKYCPSCNAKYKDVIVVSSDIGETKIICPVCGEQILE